MVQNLIESLRRNPAWKGFHRLLIVSTLLLLSLPVPVGSAESDAPISLQAKDLLVHLQYGRPIRISSQKLYSNFHNAALCLSWEKPCGLRPFSKSLSFTESLLLEFRLAKIWGKGIPLAYDQISEEKREQAHREGREPTTDWDVFQVGLAPFYRLYYPLSKKLRSYLELGTGLTWLQDPLIENGTRWNFSLYGGLGLDWRLKDLPFYFFLRFEHFSNGGKLWRALGWTEKQVIGPESVALGIGLRFSP